MAQLVMILNDDCDVFEPSDVAFLARVTFSASPPRVASRRPCFKGFRWQLEGDACVVQRAGPRGSCDEAGERSSDSPNKAIEELAAVGVEVGGGGEAADGGTGDGAEGGGLMP